MYFEYHFNLNGAKVKTLVGNVLIYNIYYYNKYWLQDV